jgi:hypothetical protein
MQIFQKLIVITAFALLPIAAHAGECDKFKAAFIADAAQHKQPAPKFQSARGNPADGKSQSFSVVMFDDARATLTCSDGWAMTFVTESKSSDPASISHVMLLATMGFHDFFDDRPGWQEAVATRDRLVEAAKASDQKTSEVRISEGWGSCAINAVGVLSFEIWTAG